MLIVIFFSSLVLALIGHGGGLIFSPLFLSLDFLKSMAVSALLFLKGIAAALAVIVYILNKMVDFSVFLPLIVASSLEAQLGALTTHSVHTKLFFGIMAERLKGRTIRILFGLVFLVLSAKLFHRAFL